MEEGEASVAVVSSEMEAGWCGVLSSKCDRKHPVFAWNDPGAVKMPEFLGKRVCSDLGALCPGDGQVSGSPGHLAGEITVQFN